MNDDHSQPGMHKPAPESQYRDEDDWSSHSRHHGRAHHNHQAVEPGGDQEQNPSDLH
jgi:hypothetical protein